MKKIRIWWLKLQLASELKRIDDWYDWWFNLLDDWSYEDTVDLIKKQNELKAKTQLKYLQKINQLMK